MFAGYFQQLCLKHRCLFLKFFYMADEGLQIGEIVVN